ncbi:zinc-binding dehydrogenase [Cryobacterium sp. Y62]|uniref:zinc-dependent alcohol dehydrogenase n=1 Tax=Cryobacterium sp. Y62 TaxID=2048284 RepID=UPI0021008C2F|nr:alcohol dehydrogenase catalytic domain-containing protein [Cryobacterium sp. Y62]
MLVRITSAGVCGSDITALRGVHPFRVPPLISGHEGGGTVVSLGAEVPESWLGRSVAIEPQKACGTCEPCMTGVYHLCRDRLMLGMVGWSGTLAEYVVAPTRCLFPVSPAVPDDLLALVEPLAVAHHAVMQAAEVAKRKIAVLGGGTIGGLIVHFLHEFNAETVVVSDIRPHNRSVGIQFGATGAVDPFQKGWKEEAFALAGGRFDVVFVAAAVPGIVDEAVSLLRPQGQVVQVGLFSAAITFDITALQQDEISIVGSNVYTGGDFAAGVATLEKHPALIRQLVNAISTLEEASDYLTGKMFGSVDDVVKMLVIPAQPPSEDRQLEDSHVSA